MMVRCMRWVGGLVVNHAGLVTALSLVITLLLYGNIHNLRTGTDLANLFGDRDPQWRAASQIGKELGYGNQLFVVIETPAIGAPAGAADNSGPMEDMADRLTADMNSSGLFVDALPACRTRNCSTWCGSSPGISRRSRCPIKRKI